MDKWCCDVKEVGGAETVTDQSDEISLTRVLPSADSKLFAPQIGSGESTKPAPVTMATSQPTPSWRSLCKPILLKGYDEVL